MAPSAPAASLCRKSMISPSLFDWKGLISAPISPARRRPLSSISAREREPYPSGSLWPRVFRLGPLISSIRIFLRARDLPLRLPRFQPHLIIERLSIHASLLLLCDVRMYLRGVGAGVSEELLDDSQLRPAAQLARGEA